MESVKVNKAELVKIVTNNKKEHASIYNEAIQKYRTQLEEKILNLLEMVRNKEDVSHSIDLVKPSNYLQQYQRALKMLEMSVEDEVTLDAVTFKNLVMDEWDWKTQFLYSNAAYSHKAESATKEI